MKTPQVYANANKPWSQWKETQMIMSTGSAQLCQFQQMRTTWLHWFSRLSAKTMGANYGGYNYCDIRNRLFFDYGGNSI